MKIAKIVIVPRKSKKAVSYNKKGYFYTHYGSIVNEISM